MIVVVLNKKGFEYDVHSLVKAFYPETDVKLFVEGEKEIHSDVGFPEFYLQWEGNKIRFLQKMENEQKLLGETSYNDDRSRLEIKNEVKKLLYNGMHQLTEKELPWGTLTGIRPTKMAMQLLKDMNHEDAKQYMRDMYYTSDEKIDLAIRIAERERKLLSTLHYKDGYSLYIGIPFCPTTCLYCSFTSYPICSWKERVDEYLDALFVEMDYIADAWKERILDTIYVGGGTPTTLEAEQLDRLLTHIEDKFDLHLLQEFTVEAGRADSITREKLLVLKKHKITRISVNPQTMKDKTLQMIGRRHSVAQVKESFLLARECGFHNINMDIILGLPGETADDVKETIAEIIKMKPDSLTVHSLAIKRASKMSQWIEENGMETLHNTDDTMKIAASGAQEMGMEPYYLYRQKNMSGNFENVGYAREGCDGIYNILIMEDVQDIVAIGAGTVSKKIDKDTVIKRCDTVKDVELYIKNIKEMIERKKKLFQ